MSDLPDDLIPAKVGAEVASVDLSTMHRWIQRGVVQGWKRAGRWFVSRAEIRGLYRPAERKGGGPVPLTRREREKAARQGYEWAQRVLAGK